MKLQLGNGLKTVIHKARFETICNSPLIVYDGCHNDDSVLNFMDMVDMYYKNTNKTFVVSILKNKDYNTILKELSIFKNSSFIFTSGNDSERYLSKEKLMEFFQKYTSNSNFLTLELSDAINYILQKSSSNVNFVVGSFYIYGDVINIIDNNKNINANK